MNQRIYVKEVLKRFIMEECKPDRFPFDVNSRLLKLSDEEFVDVQKNMEGVPHKAGVGSLIYAMVATKADISFAVSMVSRFMSKAGPPHWMAVKHIIRYFKGILDFKLCLGGKDIILRVFYIAYSILSNMTFHTQMLYY